MKKTFFLILLITIPVLAFPQAGSFDATFDFDGKSSNCHSYTIHSIDAGFQSDGKIVCYGVRFDSNIAASATRFNTDGTVDVTFGTNGSTENSIISAFPPNVNYYAFGMAIQSDDKIILMGLRQGGSNAFWIIRLLPDGAIDTSFNTTGFLELNFGSIQDIGTCIELQNDGKIIVGGSTAENYFCMARLNENGSLDTTFGIGGRVQTAFNGMQSYANSIAIQTNGNIILGGYTVNGAYAKDFAMIRYDSNGNVDTSFGDNGKVITTLNTSYSDIITKVIIQEDGKIVAGGYTSYEFDSKLAMVRYLSNGTVDSSFGNNGIVISDYNSTNANIALQVDGKLLLVGGFDGATITILRYQNNGSIDASFGTNGFVDGGYGFGGYASTVLIQQDNKIVVTGSAPIQSEGIPCYAVTRLNPGTLSNETFANSNVKLYPNPTTGTVFFDNSNSGFNKVLVYNYLGQKVFEKLNLNVDDNKIDLSNLGKGTYFINFIDFSNRVTKTLILK